MNCPECGAATEDASSTRCTRCGATLPHDDSDATDRLRADEAPSSGTAQIAERDGGRTSRVDRAGWRDATVGAAGAWRDATAGAAVAFLALLCVGVVLVAAVKLDQPSIGAGVDPITVLTWIVIAGLAVLGAPLQIGEVEVAVLPLGALAVAGAAIAWSARTVVERAPRETDRAAAVEGAKLAVPFALLCLVGAVMFRYRAPRDVVGIAPGAALVLGGLWAAAFGALGGLRSRLSWAGMARRASDRLSARGRVVFEGVIAGGTMFAVAVTAAAAATLAWGIIGLARGSIPARFDAGRAVAAIVYLGALLPNVVMAVLSLSFGADVSASRGITVRGRVLGDVDDVSLFDGSLPWFAVVLVVIPLVASVVGGFVAGRIAARAQEMAKVLGLGAVVFAGASALFVLLGRARLGAGLVHERGFALISPDVLSTLVLAFLWGSVFGYAGWRLARSPTGRAIVEPLRR